MAHTSMEGIMVVVFIKKKHPVQDDDSLQAHLTKRIGHSREHVHDVLPLDRCIITE